MEEEKPVVRARVANIVGVPSTPTLERTLTPPLRENKRPPKSPPLKHVRITKECGDLTRSGYIYKAMTNLGAAATQLKYDVMLRSLKGVDEPQKVANKQTTPEGEISGMVSELVYPTVPSKNRESKKALPDYPVRGSKVYLKWDEQQIGEDTYAKGRSSGVVLHPPRVLKTLKPVTKREPPTPPIPAVKIPVTPPATVPTPRPQVKRPLKEWYFDDDMLRCKELSPDEPISKSARRFTNRSECNIALIKHLRDIRKITPERPAEIAKKIKRKVSARAEELMKKRVFPKAVKEAIEKGLERKDAPRDIERIIEKVAKTNVPDYILRRTIAKRMGAGEIVQYKVDTDKGTIIYENADEKDANAILGMPTPTGEVIPLQIKVIK